MRPRRLSNPKGFREKRKRADVLPLRSSSQPFGADILVYLKTNVFPEIDKAIESIKPLGCSVEYEFADGMPWYVSSDVKLLMFEDRIESTEPEELTGGRIWLELIINGDHTGYKLLVKWDRETMWMNINKEQLELLDSCSSWPHRLEAGLSEYPPEPGKIGKAREEEEKAAAAVVEALVKDIKDALISLGMARRGQINEEEVILAAKTAIEKHRDISYDDLAGKAVAEYLKKGG